MQSFDKTFDFPYLDLLQIVYSDKNYVVESLVIETFNCGSTISQMGAPTLEGMLKPIITARKRSCGKVMFLQVSVILLTGGGGYPIMPCTTTI